MSGSTTLLPGHAPLAGDEPMDVAARWPVDRPLVMVHSARPHDRWARWSILAAPRAVYRFDGRRSRWLGDDALRPGGVRFTDDPLVDLQRLIDAAHRDAPADAPPFNGGFIGYLSYDLGRRLEPAAQAPGAARDDRGWPEIELAWCPDALVHDNREGRWHVIGDAVPPPRDASRAPAPERVELPPLSSTLPRPDYLAAVARTRAYIAAGDIFQANITQRLTTRWSGSTRDLCAAAFAASGAWYGAYLEMPSGRSVLSLSPELFLELDPATRRVVTRPIKGTRPGHVDQRELLDSAKDAAELNMIIDLLRNDLGRVCAFGSVRVTGVRSIESHPTVHHGVGEVTGVLRAGVDLADVLRATFPGGSITGAPKIRAMQIIDELEPVRRGPYCGAIGFIGRGGHVALNIAIRTLLISGERPAGRHDVVTGLLDYGAGGGIVADSVPEAEYEESLAKAEVLVRALGGGRDG